MAFLCAQVDAEFIQLLGRRGSDNMPRYLHVQAQPVMHNLSRLMVQAGQFSLIPGQDVPNFANPEAEPVLFLPKHPSHPATLPATLLVPALCLHFICTLLLHPRHRLGLSRAPLLQWRYSAALVGPKPSQKGKPVTP
jgi:hypothetical protein